MRIKFLKFMAWFTAILGILSSMMLDSESIIPSIVCAVCIAWWMLFGYANNWFEDAPKPKEKRRATRDKESKQKDFGRVV